MVTKKEAAALLRKYDKMRSDLRMLEHQLNRACADYGRTHLGVYGYSKDHLRMQLEREKDRAA
jgi:hypothetical protein